MPAQRDYKHVIYRVKKGKINKFLSEQDAVSFVQDLKLKPGTYLLLTDLEWDVVRNEISSAEEGI